MADLGKFSQKAISENRPKNTRHTCNTLEMSPVERAEYDQAIATARVTLGEEVFTAAWAEGRAMTIEQAITYTLELQDD
jgi:hypothetical protein